MELEIRRIQPEDARAYVEFFDTTPHDDHVPEHTCYCVNWCAQDHRGLPEPDRASRREMALEYVQNGTLQGYLALDGGKIIGWCNANTKEDCRYCAGLLYAVPELQQAPSAREEKVKAVYCFMVAEEYHRQGVARALLRAVCADAAAEGFDAVEAYPHKNAGDVTQQYAGPEGLFLSEGFHRTSELPTKWIVRKELKEIDRS